MVTIQTVTTETHSMEDNPFVGCTMVVTGKVEPYTRSGINAKIESLGAVAGSSVTKKTDYLICGETPAVSWIRHVPWASVYCRQASFSG